MDPTSRERAINILDGFGWHADTATAFVDAIIDAARSSESEHTRHVKNLRRKGECPLSPTTFHERTVNNNCRHCGVELPR